MSSDNGGFRRTELPPALRRTLNEAMGRTVPIVGQHRGPAELNIHVGDVHDKVLLGMNLRLPVYVLEASVARQVAAALLEHAGNAEAFVALRAETQGKEDDGCRD